jgi:outer membrane lipoprotein SlyB
MHKALSRLCRLLAVLAVPAGCAPARPPAPPVIAVPAAAVSDAYGVIVAARPLPPGGGAAGDMRATVLAALGAAAAGGPAAAHPALEFIVRDAAGRTVSVVQDNPQQLRPGDRVAIRRAQRTELVRAADGPTIAAAGG